MAQVDFKKLKKMSSDQFGTLNKAIEKLSNSGFQNDKENYWSATTDKEGNGSAIIRFVPSPAWFESDGTDENTLFVRMFAHGFQGPTGKWYIENSLTTLNQEDPVAKHNSELWNSGIDAKKEIARKQKRKLSYISNILVIKDPANPDNNGKVFLFKYGKKIFDKIKDAMNADPNLDETPVNAFDVFDQGANFKLSLRKVDGFTNYDKSAFADVSSLNEDQIQLIADKGHSLAALIDPEKAFKTYEELEKRLNIVLDIQTNRQSIERAHAPASEAPSIAEDPSVWDANDEDADLDYFKKLAEDN